MVAWDLSSKRKRVVYYTERGFNDASNLIRFAKTVGLCKEVSELSAMASSVRNPDGVFFIPNFVSMAGFVGLTKHTTRREHLVRAVLEAIVFNVANFFFLTKEETNYHFDKIRIDGGISENDFICQSIADLTNIERIERSADGAELTSYGVAYLSSYLCNGGINELENAPYRVGKVFTPNESNRKELFMRYKKFEYICKKIDKAKI